MVSKDYIYINGVSSNDYGLYIDTPPIPPMMVRRGSLYSTGAENDGFTDENGYDNITVKIRAYSFFQPDFDNTELNWWLNGAKTLQTSRFSKYFYKVLKVSAISSSQIAEGQRIMYEIFFLCQPFKYFVDNQPIELKPLTIIENKGKIFSRPIYKFKISGEFKIAVNNVFFTVENTEKDREITIDCENMVVYDAEKHFLRTVGNFPLLNIGNNRVGILGATTGTVKVNARC